MKKVYAILFLMLSLVGDINAQDINTVREFMGVLSNWVYTKDAKYTLKLDSLCSASPSFRASDNFTHTLVKKDSFLFCCQKLMDEGASISYSDIKQNPNSEVFQFFSDIEYPNITWISYNIEISRAIKMADTLDFIIKNDEIVKICSIPQNIE